MGKGTCALPDSYLEWHSLGRLARPSQCYAGHRRKVKPPAPALSPRPSGIQLSHWSPSMPSTLITSRTSAFIRQGGLCCYCDEPMWLADPATFAARYGLTRRQVAAHRCTAEHLHARCDGGRDGRQNIAAACALCNHRRHARRAVAPDPDAYRRLVLERLRCGRWRPWRVRPADRPFGDSVADVWLPTQIAPLG